MTGGRSRQPTVVVGGGPAGLAAAYRLSEDAGRPVLLLERAPRLGGLAAGMERKGMRLDFGPHRLHTSIDADVMRDLRDLLGDEIELHERRGLIFVGGRYLPFPPNAMTLVRLGIPALARLGWGMLAARRRANSPNSYADAVTQAVGRPLYEMFYGPYAEKVWGLTGDEIAVEQAERRVNQRGPLDFMKMLVGASPSRRFLYPRGGFGRIPHAYAEALATRPNVQVLCASAVESLRLEGGAVRELKYLVDGGVQTVTPEHVVWSAPLADLVRLAESSPESVRHASAELRTRAVIIAYAEIRRPYVGKADTYYFPEKRFPFNRVVEQKRFSVDTVAGHRTVLIMDIACDADSAQFYADEKTLRDRVGAGLEAARLCGRDEVVDFWSVRFRSAYPVYTRDTVAALAVVRSWTDSFTNLWLIGRQGLFLHNNTHHSLLMGYRAAAAIGGGTTRIAWIEEVQSFSDFTVAD